MMSSKVIGINTLFLIPNEVGGTEYYTRSFLAELEKHDTQNQYVVFCNRENFATFAFTNPLWKKVLCDVSARQRLSRILYEQCVLPLNILRHGCDILHSFGYIGPFLSPTKQVITVHDANWKDHQEDVAWLPRIVMSALMQGSLFFAKNIITDSEFSFERLGYHFPQYRFKMSVIEPGLDEQLLKLMHTKQTLPPKVTQPFLLCVSGFYPHKRVSYLLELWQKKSAELSSYSLVVVGKNGGEVQKIQELAQQSQRVRVLEKVSLPQLVGLYQHADLFVFPSVYEGFGFPVYEALAAGLPVLVGKRACYSSSVQYCLSELTFDVDADCLMIKKALKKKTKPFVIESYEKATEKLLSLYRNA